MVPITCTQKCRLQRTSDKWKYLSDKYCRRFIIVRSTITNQRLTWNSVCNIETKPFLTFYPRRLTSLFDVDVGLILGLDFLDEI